MAKKTHSATGSRTTPSNRTKLSRKCPLSRKAGSGRARAEPLGPEWTSMRRTGG